MSSISVTLVAIIFCIIQISLLKKKNKKWIKYMPITLGGIGVLLGIVIYYISYIPFLLEMQSQSVLSENQYLGLTVCILFMPCLVGALLGIVIKKFLGKKQFLYFLPFIIFVVVYIGAVIMGLGMISVKEVIWIALFLISGFLLSKEKVWGCLFGMIPGIVFIGLSTKDTGQVINIELPLGMIIIGFYLGCGIGIYRKSHLKK